MNGLPVVPLNGLSADSLGVYLASLGLFSLVARKWPRVRAVWRNASFCLVGGPPTLEQTIEFVSEIGKTNCWTPYDRPWDKDKKADVAKKTSMQTARWRALEAEERLLPAFGAHLALDGRVRMNPLLGTGGNAGKRDFAKGWKDAIQVIQMPTRKQGREVLDNDLKAFLVGGTCTYLSSFQAGSWFGVANKIPDYVRTSSFTGIHSVYVARERVIRWPLTLAERVARRHSDRFGTRCIGSPRRNPRKSIEQDELGT